MSMAGGGAGGGPSASSAGAGSDAGGAASGSNDADGTGGRTIVPADRWSTKPVASGGAPGLDLGKACPDEVPLESESDRVGCEQAVRCDYIDGSQCACAPCVDGEGLCWTCALAPLAVGCPRQPPTRHASCDWSDAFCAYGDCQRWNDVAAVCCNGQWLMARNECPTQVGPPL
jgi:hypothetical protein